MPLAGREQLRRDCSDALEVLLRISEWTGLPSWRRR